MWLLLLWLLLLLLFLMLSLDIVLSHFRAISLDSTCFLFSSLDPYRRKTTSRLPPSRLRDLHRFWGSPTGIPRMRLVRHQMHNGGTLFIIYFDAVTYLGTNNSSIHARLCIIMRHNINNKHKSDPSQYMTTYTLFKNP